MLVHFAGKRFPNEDVYVFVSKSDKDARQVLGKELTGHRVHFSIAGRSELFELERLLNDHQDWLSKNTGMGCAFWSEIIVSYWWKEDQSTASNSRIVDAKGCAVQEDLFD